MLDAPRSHKKPVRGRGKRAKLDAVSVRAARLKFMRVQAALAGPQPLTRLRAYAFSQEDAEMGENMDANPMKAPAPSLRGRGLSLRGTRAAAANFAAGAAPLPLLLFSLTRPRVVARALAPRSAEAAPSKRKSIIAEEGDAVPEESEPKRAKDATKEMTREQVDAVLNAGQQAASSAEASGADAAALDAAC